MNLQHERLSHLCTELRLGGVAVEYSAAAQKAAETEASFVDFWRRCCAASSIPAGLGRARCCPG